MRLAWLTDIHLDHCEECAVEAFVTELAKLDTDAFLISGDIANSSSLGECLVLLHDCLKVPIYFVLGNHDFYGSSIKGIRRLVSGFCRECPRLHWLNQSVVVRLTSEVALVGHDGWYDLGFGDHKGAPFRLNDFSLIRELTGLSPQEERAQCEKLAAEAVRHLSTVLREAAREYSKVLILTHVPAFAEGCLYRGKPSAPWALPFFASRRIGEEVLAVATEFPGVEFLMFSGHTHDACVYRAHKNLVLEVGGAVYEKPKLQRIIEV